MTEKSHRWIWVSLGATSITFHIWLIFSGLVPSLVSRPLHMALALPWVFVFAALDQAAEGYQLVLVLQSSLLGVQKPQRGRGSFVVRVGPC